ncbi:MAG: hypothetical protein K5770_12120 [Lachnospiraceae bacterium]|nr:hypothetical protein [Lachnospiraceae bacterium]
MYIGQTRDGLPDGRGYEYDGDGRLRLKGHFKSGLPDGNVTEYTRDGIKIYEGQMIEGKRNGTGKLWEYNDDGSVYSLYYGSFSDDKKSGYGLSTVYKYGDIVSRYEGGYYGGYRTGFGINEYEIENTGEKHIYCGNFHNGYLYGYGVIYDSSHQLLKSGFFKEDKLEQPLKPEEFEEPAGELEKYKCPAVTIWD